MAEHTAARERTRQALLRAGIEVLSADPSAALGEVASRAGVARSTLHRYFPDRRALVTAVSAYTTEEYEEAFTDARIEQGPALEAFRRLSLELMERLDVLAWWMGAGLTALAAEDESAAAEFTEPDEDEERLHRLVLRGHEDGTIDPQMGPQWIEGILWSTMYSAKHVLAGTATTFDIHSQALRGLLKAVAADPASV